MEKEFIQYEQALALKELGFDEPCNTCYDKLQMVSSYSKDVFDYKNYNTSGYVVSRPTFSQAFRWFREKYKLSCFIELIDNSKHYYFDFTICDSKNRDWDDMNCFDSCKRIYDYGKFGTYEVAELECLRKLIEIVKEIV